MDCNSVGIIREIDKQGRLVIPKEYREMFKLNKEVEVLATTDGVLVRSKRYEVVFYEAEVNNDN